MVTEDTGACSLVRDGENGYLIQSGDPNAIAERLTFLANSRDRIDSMGEAARGTVATLSLNRFRQHYVPELIALSETVPR
jgi:glycosyltransferase involved in cell wall biosynthesis